MSKRDSDDSWFDEMIEDLPGEIAGAILFAILVLTGSFIYRPLLKYGNIYFINRYFMFTISEIIILVIIVGVALIVIRYCWVRLFSSNVESRKNLLRYKKYILVLLISLIYLSILFNYIFGDLFENHHPFLWSIYTIITSLFIINIFKLGIYNDLFPYLICSVLWIISPLLISYYPYYYSLALYTIINLIILLFFVSLNNSGILSKKHIFNNKVKILLFLISVFFIVLLERFAIYPKPNSIIFRDDEFSIVITKFENLIDSSYMKEQAIFSNQKYIRAEIIDYLTKNKNSGRHVQLKDNPRIEIYHKIVTSSGEAENLALKINCDMLIWGQACKTPKGKEDHSFFHVELPKIKRVLEPQLKRIINQKKKRYNMSEHQYKDLTLDFGGYSRRLPKFIVKKDGLETMVFFASCLRDLEKKRLNYEKFIELLKKINSIYENQSTEEKLSSINNVVNFYNQIRIIVLDHLKNQENKIKIKKFKDGYNEELDNYRDCRPEDYVGFEESLKALFYEEKYVEIIKEYNAGKRLVEMDKYDKTFLYNMLGISYVRKRSGEDFNKAEKFFRLAVNEDPSDLDSKINLALVLRTNSKYEEAKRQLNKVLTNLNYTSSDKTKRRKDEESEMLQKVFFNYGYAYYSEYNASDEKDTTVADSAITMLNRCKDKNTPYYYKACFYKALTYKKKAESYHEGRKEKIRDTYKLAKHCIIEAVKTNNKDDKVKYENIKKEILEALENTINQ